MLHLVARAAPGRLLFTDACAATALWDIVVAHFPDLHALCLMPNHVHLIVPVAPGLRLGHAMSSFARWRAHHGGRSGALWSPHPPPETIPGDKHLRRTVRYVLLNPCRARLAADPLAWPWSTHRDRVGLVARPVGPVEALSNRFHAYVSGDPTVDIEGTALPTARPGPWAPSTLGEAVLAVYRAPPEALVTRHPARATYVRASWLLGERDRDALAARTRLTVRRVNQLICALPSRGAPEDPPLRAVLRAVGDPRMAGWPRWTRSPGGWRYLERERGASTAEDWAMPLEGTLGWAWAAPTGASAPP